MRKNILISLLTLLLLNVQLLASGVDWTVNVHNYQYDMTAYVTLRLNGADVADLSSYTIAAFCNDEYRGVMEARSVDNNTYGYLRIRSNQFSGEIITFKVYDPVSDRIAISTNQITFQSQQVIGYPSSPFVVEAMFQNWEPEFITICYGDSFAWDKSGKTYTESGVYTTIYDNAQATLHLTVLPEVPTTTEYATICHGETYTWNGQTYSTEGEYSVTLQNALGCDSIVTLHLTVNQTKHAEEHITACDSYTWNGQTYTQSGDYIYTTTAANGCDSIVTLHLTINQTQYAEVTATACDSYTWNGETYTESGEYVYTITAANGCDSIVTLHLTINATKYAEESITACDSYTWNGETYTQSGDYVYTTTATNGCDSIVTLHLTINQTKHAEKSVTACDSYEWNGEIYTESGEYVYTTTAANGCDSIVTLHLTINATKYAEEIITACDSYTWNGETYTQSGEYVYTTTASNGCDSIVTLHLTINQTKHAEKSVTACDSYEWNGEIYTESGDYVYTTTATNGCDSIVTLHLTINQTQYAEESVVACDSYEWNGETYTESGEYVYTTTAANGCDSIITLRLTINQTQYAEVTATACDSYTWNGETYTQSGEYVYTTTAANGCDSIVTLHLTINNSEIGATEYATICYGETYTWNGQTYSTEGEYSVTLSNTLGCDSVATLQLTIMPEAVTTTETVVIGSDELPYVWRGNTYSVTGRYTDIEQYATIACDSVIHVLDLTVLTTGNHDEQSVTICETEAPYLWYGESYPATGKYTYTEKYVGTDIDSIQHILNLTVNPTIYAEESITACDSYTWNGETYTESGDYVYTTTADNGCDSIVTLHLTINNSEIGETEYVTICHGETYTWNGQTYSTEGEYSVTLQNAFGCDSVASLHLTILPAAITTAETVVIGSDELPYVWRGNTYTATGRYTDVEHYATIACDSAIHVLDLTVLNTDNYDEQSVTICETEAPYTWYGESYTATGKYAYTEKYVGTDIDSIQHILNLTVNPTVYTEETITACDSYTWNGETYTTSGEYVYTTTASNGCDSIVTLHLTINQTQYAEVTATACDSYTWNGETYTESGEYVYTTTAANGCDSIVTLHLTINATKYAEESITACDSYTWNGETYTESGDYTYTTTAANGCDSIVTLHLTINNSEVAALEYVTICYGETYTWNGQTYSTEGEYSVTLSNTLGCDSVATLHLTIMPEAITSTETVVIGSDELPYVWRGNTYSVTGRYTDIEQYATIACDSVIHVLDLTVLTTGNHDEQSVTICETEAPYTWYGESYSATGKYTYTEKYVGTDIDSIQHILNLTVNPTVYTEEHITACDSYTWNGETYTQSGDYVYTTIASNGCDSIVTLHLTINNTQYVEESIVACDSYTWNGETYTTSGEYVYTTPAANGCDSIVTLHLTIKNTQYAEESVVACDSYTWNGEIYTESGEYVYTTPAANGCDSIVTLHLTINNSEIGATEYATICYGETYTWNGQVYSTEGEYGITLQNAFGCDSVATLHLTIMPAAITTTEIVVVGSDELPYTWRGNTYSTTGRYTNIEQYTTVACDSAIHVLDLTVLNTDNYDEQSVTICETEAPYTWYGESYSATGKYTYTEKYVGTDIDSIQHILNLTVNPTKYAEESITACDSYTWNGETYTESGDYVYTTTAANGCDSIVTLHLTINQTQYAEKSVTACDSYEWNGENYTESGDYVYTTIASNGCDSIVTLHLTINQTQYAEVTATACDSYTWNGETYTTSGDYVYTTTTANGCDSIVTLHLTINQTQYAEVSVVACDSYTWNGQTYTQSGDYIYTTTAANGCDSIVTLHLTINQTQYAEVTATACDSYTWNGETYTTSGEYVYTTAAANGCDSIVTLHLTINQTQYAEKSVTACNSYEWNGEIYTESGDYVYTTTAANGCDRVEVLHLTILPKAIAETEILALCPSELPYEWYGQSLTEAGLYTATEQYSGMSCDSIIHELTLNIFVQTLPEQLTLPIVQPGKPIDVTIPTEEILAYIAAQTWYAPNAWVVWYVKDGAEWGPLTTEPVSSAASNVVLKYAVETDCDIIESTAMTIIIEPTSVDLIQSVEKSTHKIICNDKVWIIRNDEMYNIVGVKVTEVR